MKLYFLIPIYNKAEALKGLFSAIDSESKKLGMEYEIFAVNDGSLDNSRNEIISLSKNFPIKLIDFEKNQGPGAGFRAGFVEILGQKSLDGSDAIISMEADLSSDLKLLKKLLAGIHAGNDVVVASCYAPDGKVVNDTFLRLFLSKATNAMLKFLFPMPIHTYTGFYRAYNAKSAQNLFKKFNKKVIESNGFDGATELLLKFQKMKAKAAEVPMVLVCDKSKGSSMKVFKTIMDYLKLISRNIFI